MVWRTFCPNINCNAFRSLHVLNSWNVVFLNQFRSNKTSTTLVHVCPMCQNATCKIAQCGIFQPQFFQFWHCFWFRDLTITGIFVKMHHVSSPQCIKLIFCGVCDGGAFSAMARKQKAGWAHGRNIKRTPMAWNLKCYITDRMIMFNYNFHPQIRIFNVSPICAGCRSPAQLQRIGFCVGLPQKS